MSFEQYEIPSLDSLSKKTLQQAVMNEVQGGILKTFFDDWGVDGKYPEDSDLIDFSTLEKAPRLYNFATKHDKACSEAQFKLFEGLMAEHIEKTYWYDCDYIDHEWFGNLGPG